MVKVKSESEVAQSCPTLCDPMYCSLPGCSVHGIFQAIVLEWIAISFSGGSSRPGLNPGLPHCRQTFYHLSHQGSPWLIGAIYFLLVLETRSLKCPQGWFLLRAVREGPVPRFSLWLWMAVFPQHLCNAVPLAVPVPTSSCSYKNSSHIGGERNGNPLHCSCLENPRDGGA